MRLADKVIAWTKQWFADNRRKTAVIGISGGKDSAVVAAICKEALGAKNVVGIMMPNGEQADINDSVRVIDELDIFSGCANIGPAYEAILQCVEDALGRPASPGAKINIAPRLRMTLLYTIAQTISEEDGAKACVVGTGNLSEAQIGYTTKHGDSASDVNPIRNLWVDEVIQVGDDMGYFPDIVHKEPSDGLCGKTDEARFGFPYSAVKAVFTGEAISDDIAQKVLLMHATSRHKREPLPSFPRPEA